MDFLPLKTRLRGTMAFTDYNQQGPESGGLHVSPHSRRAKGPSFDTLSLGGGI